MNETITTGGMVEMTVTGHSLRAILDFTGLGETAGLRWSNPKRA